VTDRPPDSALAGSPTVPSRDDPIVATASQAIGGAWGRYAGSGRWWTPLRVLLAFTCVTLVLAYLQKAPCASGNWVGNKQYTHLCYSDIVPLWGAEGLDVGAVPYRDHAVEYPVLTGAFMWFTSGLTHLLDAAIPALTDAQLFALLSCVLLAICGLLMVAGTVGAAGRRPYDAALVALSPLLVFHAFSNWDLFAMAFMSCAMWTWARSRPVAAGTFIGLGAAAKLYPGLLLVPIWILAVRTRRYPEAAWATITTILVWCAVNVPVAVAYPTGWWEFYRFSAVRPTEASTFWAIGHYLANVGFFGQGYASAWTPPGAAVAFAVFAGVAAVALLGLSAPTRPRMAQLAFLIVLAFLLTTKVWSPQYSVWLVPLIALARPRWTMNLIWQFSEIAVWIATLLWLLGYYDSARGLDYGALMILLLIRDGLLIGIAVQVVREMWRPELDIVRSSGLDDPGGGPFEGAEDQVIVTLRVPAAFRPAPRPEPAGETPLPPEDPVAPPG
jgi:uncharacterized membrane protein